MRIAVEQQIIADRSVILRRALPDEILALRHAELRAGLPIDTARFRGDEATTTMHYGAFLDDDQINIGCVSFVLNPWDGQDAYQLRGMATRADLARRGIGSALMLFAQRDLASSTDIRVLWCNARVPAVGFYESHGWTVVSDPFDIPTAGPHVRMTFTLAP